MNAIRNLFFGEKRTAGEEDNEESPFAWIVGEFDFKNNNEDLEYEKDLLQKAKKKKKPKRKEGEESNSSNGETSFTTSENDS